MEKGYVTYSVDKETGEYLGEARGKFISSEQTDAYLKKIYSKRTQNEYGAFTWLLFNSAEELLPNITPANITRLMYVSTFLGYEGYLINYNKNMTKKMLQGKMKMDRRYFAKFYNEMIDNNIFIEKDNKIYLNNEIFRRGKTKNISSEFTRLCIEGIRYLYENCEDAKQHKTMSYLFKAIPYINKEWNIIVKNDINIKYREQVEPMTLTEFANLIGYGNVTKLTKQLDKIKIAGEYAFVFVRYGGKTNMIINPNLYFAGKDWNNVKGLADWCIK